MSKPMSEEECEREVQAALDRVRSRPRGVRPGSQHVPKPRVACARQANFAARHTTIEADIVVDTPWRGRVLIAEVTWFKDPSIARAVDFRETFSPFWTTDPDYFMLVLREHFHLWRRETPLDGPPDFSGPIHKVWSKYLGELAKDPEALISQVMEIAIWAWLFDLASGVRQPDPESEADQVLLTSGLYGLMKHGSVDSHVRA